MIERYVGGGQTLLLVNPGRGPETIAAFERFQADPGALWATRPRLPKPGSRNRSAGALFRHRIGHVDRTLTNLVRVQADPEWQALVKRLLQTDSPPAIATYSAISNEIPAWSSGPSPPPPGTLAAWVLAWQIKPGRFDDAIKLAWEGTATQIALGATAGSSLNSFAGPAVNQVTSVLICDGLAALGSFQENAGADHDSQEITKKLRKEDSPVTLLSSSLWIELAM